MDFDKVIQKRASIRGYSGKKPQIEKIIKAIEAANKAPTPGNLQLLSYTIIEKPETIQKIAQACQQEFVQQAPFVVVVCSKPKHCERLYDKKGKIYLRQHAGAAIENFLLKIIDLGLSSCWVGAFSEVTLKTLLRIPEDIDIEAVLPIGYKLVFDKTTQKRKPHLENRVFFEVYKNKHKYPYKKVGEH